MLGVKDKGHLLFFVCDKMLKLENNLKVIAGPIGERAT